jgi:hypothetical protein
MNRNSCWRQGDKVSGIYCDIPFVGAINSETRGTPDGRNVTFGVTLDQPIVVFGAVRERISVSTDQRDGYAIVAI